MNSITLKLLARTYMGLAMSEDIVAWAMEMLEEGYDTESLVILAGLMKPLFRQEVEHYFKHAIRELGWTWPSDVALCLQAYALDVARAIIAGKIPPVEGCSEMYHIAGTLNYPKYLSAWVMLYEGLDPEGSYTELSDEELDAAIVNYARHMLEECRDR